MWSTLNSFIKPVNENIICKIKKDDVFVNDKRMISNLFNDYFSSVVIKLISQRLTTKFDDGYFDIFELSPMKIMSCFKIVLPNEVFFWFWKLKSSSLDVGHISRRVFDLNPQYFTLTLTNLINNSLEGGYFLDIFKLSNVVPVFKKDCHFQLNSYTPISIASLVCKLYEKLVRLQISKFLNDNNLINLVLFKHLILK